MAPPWSRASLNRTWNGRTLRIFVSPGPTTFAERRSVLQVLKQKGAIEMFRPVPGYPSQYLAATKTRETASSLVSSSPLNYSVSVPRRTADVNLIDMSRPSLLDGTQPAIHTPGPASAADETEKQRTNFTLRVVEVEGYNHAETMSSSPLHGSWPDSYTLNETFLSSILSQSVPSNIASTALAHWDYDPEARAERSQKKERLQLAKWMPTKMMGSSTTEASQSNLDASEPDQEPSSWGQVMPKPDRR